MQLSRLRQDDHEPHSGAGGSPLGRCRRDRASIPPCCCPSRYHAHRWITEAAQEPQRDDVIGHTSSAAVPPRSADRNVPVTEVPPKAGPAPESLHVEAAGTESHRRKWIEFLTAWAVAVGVLVTAVGVGFTAWADHQQRALAERGPLTDRFRNRLISSARRTWRFDSAGSLD
jgi:hypothetical protein